jgi:Protein of unknown function (DUF2637)
MTGILRVPRRGALAAIAVLVAAASAVSFAESYRGLYDWAAGHGLSGPWAVIWPLQVDVFIAVGELALFVALADAWSRRSRTGAWLVTLTGLAVSVAGNVGHTGSHVLSVRATAAVPPLAAAAALAVGLGVLKRVVEAQLPRNQAAQLPARSSAPSLRDGCAPGAVPAVPGARANGHGVLPAEAEPFTEELARGEVPAIRRIRTELRVGQPKAQEIQARLAVLARTQ